MKGLIVGAISLIVVVGIVLLMWVSASNTYNRLWNQGQAQQKVCEVVFDNTWKIICQKCQIADKYKDAFKEIYPELMEGRYGNARGGALLSFITESNPTLDVSIYRDVSAAIEVQRTIFTREQKKLIDLKQEVDNLRTTIPSSLFVGGKSTLEIKLVTSGKTKEAFSSGEENDVKL